MKIPVIFVNRTLGTISGDELDEMLDKKLVVVFQRSSGLAVVGRDELRSNRGDGIGSWRDRKSNQRSRAEAIILPPRNKLHSSLSYMFKEKKIETYLPEIVPIAANYREEKL